MDNRWLVILAINLLVSSAHAQLLEKSLPGRLLCDVDVYNEGTLFGMFDGKRHEVIMLEYNPSKYLYPSGLSAPGTLGSHVRLDLKSAVSIEFYNTIDCNHRGLWSCESKITINENNLEASLSGNDSGKRISSLQDTENVLQLNLSTGAFRWERRETDRILNWKFRWKYVGYCRSQGGSGLPPQK